MASITLSIEMDRMPEPYLDEQVISGWIEARLTDARNTFIDHVNTPASVSRTVASVIGNPPRGWRSAARTGAHIARRRSVRGIQDYPQRRTGELSESVPEPEMIDPRRGRIYSTAPYAGYLANAGYKMLGDALKEVLEERPQLEVLASAVKPDRGG